jgi:hypothetical protein
MGNGWKKVGVVLDQNETDWPRGAKPGPACEGPNCLSVYYLPDPLSVTDCGLAGSESTILSVAPIEPTAVGVIVRLTAQEAPPANVAPQVLV